MDIDLAIAHLQRIRAADGHGRRHLAVRLHKPGALGAVPSARVSGLHPGIDFDQGRVLIACESALTDLASDQVAAITESVRKGQSWHAMQELRTIHDQLHDAKGLLRELSAAFTRDDDLPDDLLPRIQTFLENA